MKALTLTRPWAYAVCHLGKRIENRTWAPPKSVIGQRIAIHAGKQFDREDADWIHEIFNVGLPPEREQPSGIVCTAVLAAVVTARNDPFEQFGFWWAGPVGWVLEDVQVLPEAVACRGAQKLWNVPPQIEAQIRAAVA